MPVTPHDRAADLAWAAGLYEGEGCASLEPKARSISVSIGMTDEEPIRQFHSIIGVGIVKGPFIRKGNRKPFWVWRVRSWDDAVVVYEAFKDRLSPRRLQQFEDAFKVRPARLPDIPDCGYYKYRSASNYGAIRHRRKGEVPCVGCRAAANEETRRRTHAHD